MYYNRQIILIIYFCEKAPYNDIPTVGPVFGDHPSWQSKVVGNERVGGLPRDVISLCTMFVLGTV